MGFPYPTEQKLCVRLAAVETQMTVSCRLAPPGFGISKAIHVAIARHASSADIPRQTTYRTAQSANFDKSVYFTVLIAWLSVWHDQIAVTNLDFVGKSAVENHRRTG